MQQMSAPPAAAAITGGSAGAAALPSSAQAAATPRVNKHADREQADDDRRTRGSAAPSAAEHVISHSDAPRSHSSDKGRSSMLTFAMAMAVFSLLSSWEQLRPCLINFNPLHFPWFGSSTLSLTLPHDLILVTP